MFNFSKEEYQNKIKSDKSALLFKKISSDVITPVLALLKISQKFNDYHFLFESAENGNNKGRFSVLGFMPDQIFKAKSGASFINKNAANNLNDFTKIDGDVLSNFRQFFQNAKINWDDLNYQSGALPAVCSGVFGYMGYDMVRLMENIEDGNLPDDLNIPDSIFMRPQIVVIFDNLFDQALICAPAFDDGFEFDDLANKILEVEDILQNGSLPHEPKISPKFDFQSNYSKEEYCSMVTKSKEFIKDGDIFQVLPSQRFTSNYDSNLSEFAFYRSLRSVNPSPFLFYLKMDNFVLSGSSPEIMVSLKNDKVTIRPLAGTRVRGKNADEDAKIAKELLSDEKELAEHLMLIDLGRHDVGRVCKKGTVEVTQKMIIEYYSHVMHISSNVEGKIKDNLDALDALISGFPAGTVSGAPKIRAMQIIEEIEKVRRSFYAGCVGYFASNGDMETCITLRSALIKDGKIHLQAGAGVVFDSKEESEYQECINKSQALIRACELIN